VAASTSRILWMYDAQICGYHEGLKNSYLREKNYKEITLFRQWEEQALAVEQHQYLPAEEYPHLLLRFYDT